MKEREHELARLVHRKMEYLSSFDFNSIKIVYFDALKQKVPFSTDAVTTRTAHDQ